MVDEISFKRYQKIMQHIDNDSLKNFIVLGIGEGIRQTIPYNFIKKYYNCDYYNNEEIKLTIR
jgi:hypothetical protein